jgi:hypothetical protein
MMPMTWVILRGAGALLLLAYLVARLFQGLLRGVVASPIGPVSRHEAPGGFWVMIGWRVLMIALLVLVTPIIIWGLQFTTRSNST